MKIDGEQQNESISHTKQNSPFLALPASVRLQIYSAAEVVGWNGCTFVNLNRQTSSDHGAFHNRPSFATTLALLLTCQATYKELVFLVYGRNHFFIRYNDFQNLSSLRQLSTLSTRAITKLTVHLNVASCGLGNVCNDVLYWSSQRKPWFDRTDKTLRKNDGNTKSVLEEWQHVWAEYVLPNLLGPAQLELHLICDVADLDTASIAMQPLLAAESQASLSGCSIRLSRRVNADLQILAEKTVKHVTMSEQKQDTVLPDSKSTFRFFDLPVELQRDILTLTDLVTPFREVEWSRSKGLRFRHRLPRAVTLQSPDHISGSVLRDIFTSDAEDYVGRLGCSGAYPSGCYCRAFHSAFSNVHQCKCWAPPTAIFLVNKAMRRLAMEIFFGLNRFIITPGAGDTTVPFRPSWPPTERLSASIFFRKVISEEALQYLRFIEVVFPAIGHIGPTEFCPPYHKIWRDWAKTLDYLKDRLTLQSLTIRVHFASWAPRELSTYPVIHPHPRWMIDEYYPEWARRQKKAYIEVILPMKRLRGLRAFFAHLPFPSRCTQQPYQGRVVRLTELEEEAERIVMGYEYNASAAGKYLIPESLWSEIHDRERTR